MTDVLLRVEALSVGRGDRVLASSLSFDLAASTLTHLRGRNGAGKTSLLEVLAGLRAPLSGHIDRADPALHWLGHKNGLNGDLSPIENLGFWCALHSADPAPIVAALDRLGLSKLRHRPCRMLSAGQKRRVALSRLLILRRRLWLLDEPLSALDVDGLQRVSELFSEHLAGGGGALVTSHQALPVDSASLRQLELA